MSRPLNPDTIFFAEIARRDKATILRRAEMERHERQIGQDVQEAVEDMLDIFVPKPEFERMSLENSEFWLDINDLAALAESNAKLWIQIHTNLFGVRPTVTEYESKLNQDYERLAWDYSYDGYHEAIRRNEAIYGDSN